MIQHTGLLQTDLTIAALIGFAPNVVEFEACPTHGNSPDSTKGVSMAELNTVMLTAEQRLQAQIMVPRIVVLIAF